MPKETVRYPLEILQRGLEGLAGEGNADLATADQGKSGRMKDNMSHPGPLDILLERLAIVEASQGKLIELVKRLQKDCDELREWKEAMIREDEEDDALPRC